MIETPNMKHLQRKYSLSDDYMIFLVEEYPETSMRELEQIVKDVLKSTNPDMVKDGELQIICWRCQEIIPADSVVCGKCGIDFLLESPEKEKSLDEERSFPLGITLVLLFTILDGLGRIFIGFQNISGSNSYSNVEIIFGLLELVLIFFVLARTHWSYTILVSMYALSFVSSLFAFSVFNTMSSTNRSIAPQMSDFTDIVIVLTGLISLVMLLLVEKNKSFFDT